jgi:hypothetical protein
MAKTAKGAKAHRHNIPLTAAGAKRRGFTRSRESLDELSESQKKHWLIFSGAAAAEHRKICGVRPLPGGGVKVCYIDPNTGECNDCYDSPV